MKIPARMSAKMAHPPVTTSVKTSAAKPAAAMTLMVRSTWDMFDFMTVVFCSNLSLKFGL